MKMKKWSSQWKFHIVVVQNNGKEIYKKKCAASAKLLFLLILRGWKGFLRDTGLSVFNFRERWKREIKIRELWMVCLSWYVSFKIFVRYSWF